MKIIKELIVAFITILLLVTNVSASESTVELSVVHSKENSIEFYTDELYTKKDNSKLPVKVIKQSGEQVTTVYEGLLGGYANGEYNNVDFSKIEFLMVIDVSKSEALHIIPIEASELQMNTFDLQQSNTAIMQYDLQYSITNNAMNINCTVQDSTTETITPILMVALYDGWRLVDLISNNVSLSENNGVNNFTYELPENYKDSYCVKLLVWDGLGTLKPLGQVKQIKDLESYSREKHLFITAPLNTAFNVFMNSVNSIGENNVMTHTINYDSEQMTPTDLCGLTYEKELSESNIEEAKINIVDYDFQAGKIVYQFSKPSGRNIGINNFIKFKALTDLNEAQITYIIQ